MQTPYAFSDASEKTCSSKFSLFEMTILGIEISSNSIRSDTNFLHKVSISNGMASSQVILHCHKDCMNNLAEVIRGLIMPRGSNNLDISERADLLVIFLGSTSLFM
uniref:Uncharacterized protein n=1 Tax=Cacopsylla melanoneura TaxID=428564 RepID=A0A8D8Z0X7_9HEMI